VRWFDRSVRSTALAVVLAPIAVLGAAAAAAAWLTGDGTIRALELGALLGALGVGLALWQLLGARLDDAAAQMRAHAEDRDQARKAAEDRRSMLESIFHASPDAIVVRDAQGRVVLASSALAGFAEGGQRSAPLAAEQLVDAAYRQGRLGRQDRLALDQLVHRCQTGEHYLEPVVTTGRPRPGRSGMRTFETRARPVFDSRGAVIGTVTVSRDITGRVELERRLRQATAAAERSSEAKSQFLSRMSHELRTPLNAVLGFAQLLELDELTDHQRDGIGHIQRAGHHLLSLINEVLDIARIEAGQLTVTTEPVPVRDLLDEATALLTPMAETAAVHLMVDPGGDAAWAVRADRQRLLQILLNLGSNAVKYNETGGTVAFRAAPAGDGRLRLSVHDTGPGIPPDRQDELFVPFSRLGAERSGVEGTGVGLALSKQLAEVMGGSIGVESAPGQGSMFFVDLLPVDRAAADRAAADRGADGAASLPKPAVAGNWSHPLPRAPGRSAGPGPSGDPAVLTVLQVEDDPSNASLVAQVLARRPAVRLLTAPDARSGLDLACRHRPDLALLDLNLPDTPGDQLLARIKAEPELADMKIVVVSADATPGRIRQLLDLEVDGYLTKPVGVEALLRLVDDQVGRHAGRLG